MSCVTRVWQVSHAFFSRNYNGIRADICDNVTWRPKVPYDASSSSLQGAVNDEEYCAHASEENDTGKQQQREYDKKKIYSIRCSIVVITHTHTNSQNLKLNEHYVRLLLKLCESFFNFVIEINCVRD